MFTMLLFSFEEGPNTENPLQPSSVDILANYVAGCCFFAMGIQCFAILCLVPCQAICSEREMQSSQRLETSLPHNINDIYRMKLSNLFLLQFLGFAIAYLRCGHFMEKAATGMALHSHSELFYQCAMEVFTATAIVLAPYILACKTYTDLVRKFGCGGA